MPELSNESQIEQAPQLPETQTAPPQYTPTVETPQPATTSSSTNKPMLLVLLILVIALFGGGAYLALGQRLTPNPTPLTSQPNTQNNTQESPSEAETGSKTPSEVTISNSEDTQKRMVFLKLPDKNDFRSVQAWIMPTSSQNPQRLELPELAAAYKHLNSNLVFFTQTDKESSFAVKDLNTGAIQTFTPIQHSDPTVIESVGLNGVEYISPDGTYIILQIGFRVPCPTPSPNANMHGGSGPCMPEDNAEFPWGYYLYNLKTNKIVYMGTDTMIISNWDLKNQHLYYTISTNPGSALTRFNLANNNKILVDTVPNFAYGAFKLLNSDKLLRIIGNTGDTPDGPSLAQVSIVDTKTNQEKIIDSGKWAEIQPFIKVPPDEKIAIFQRTSLINGMGLDSLWMYTISTGELKRLTPPSNELSYSRILQWVDNETFITMMDTVEQENYTNINNYIVSINTRTGDIKRLTPKDDVYRFNSF